MCSARIGGFNPIQNELMMVEHLDLLEEYREAVVIRLAEYQQKLARRYNEMLRQESSVPEIWYFGKLLEICETLMPGNWPRHGKVLTGLLGSREPGLTT